MAVLTKSRPWTRSAAKVPQSVPLGVVVDKPEKEIIQPTHYLDQYVGRECLNCGGVSEVIGRMPGKSKVHRCKTCFALQGALTSSDALLVVSPERATPTPPREDWRVFNFLIVSPSGDLTYVYGTFDRKTRRTITSGMGGVA